MQAQGNTEQQLMRLMAKEFLEERLGLQATDRHVIHFAYMITAFEQAVQCEMNLDKSGADFSNES